MEIVSIFGSGSPKMGAVHYDGEADDIFTQLLRDWHDRSYLTGLLLANKSDLDENWRLSIAEAVDYIIEEVTEFEDELLAIQYKEPGYENFDMKELFIQYHEKEFSIRKRGQRFRKARPNLADPMIRLYAIELEDGYLITGGCIKLTKQLTDKTKAIVEAQLNMVQDFINANKIVSLSDL